jgi:hypothetical protein
MDWSQLLSLRLADDRLMGNVWEEQLAGIPSHTSTLELINFGSGPLQDVW